MTDVIARLSLALDGRYVIERELGAGGMATVYLAHDARHDRKVALKVLRPELSAILGGARFLTEIKTTANLQHPHILSLFDSGEADGTVFYVMPYVDGESLRERLNREKQLPVDDAARITKEIASALDYAHRHNVVHRDIKPENILLHDGTVLVADFGIALAASRSDGATRMTETGMLLGTPHYMAPEQAMGERDITPRADIYALGCVLYEMLTGEPPFTGPTAQAIIARVMTEEPRSVTLQRHTVPPHLEAVALKALEKLPADRFASAAQLAEALEGRGPLPATRIAAAAAPSRRPFMAATAVAAVALAAAIWGWLRPRAEPPVAWQYVTFGDSLPFSATLPGFAIAPDGEWIVFRTDMVNGRLYVKRRGELAATPIAGTERSSNPVISPSGEWIAFLADGKLRKVRPEGGAAVTVADSAANIGGFGGAAWLSDAELVYVAPSLGELRVVSAAGGAYRVVFRDSALAGLSISMPAPLPDGRGVLIQVCSSNCVTMGVHVVDLRTGTQHRLLTDAAQASYVPGGRLLYVRRDGVALVAPFDLRRLEITGGATPVIDGVRFVNGFAPLISWSASGTLLYVRGAAGTAEGTIVRVTRQGVGTPIDSGWHGPLASPSLSPDGRFIAVGHGVSAGGLDIWIKRLDRGPFTRLTFSGQDRRPVVSPDSRMVAFIRDTANTSVVVVRAVDGSGGERRAVQLDRQVQEVLWSHDGAWLLVRTDNGNRGAGDILGVRLRGDTTPVPLVFSEFTELHPALSPDGRWLAYTSNESGRTQVFVRPFPNSAVGRWQVSNDGGRSPVWSANGRELFFVADDNRLMAAPVAGGATFEVAGVRPLFDVSGFAVDAFHQSFAVGPDGRFVFAAPLVADGGAPLVVRVDNWFADVRARVAGGR